MINKKFNETETVSFEPFPQKKECMVNATGMGSIFNKKSNDYLRMNSIQNYLVVLELKYGNKKYPKKCFQVAISQLDKAVNKQVQVGISRLENLLNEEKTHVNISRNIVEVIHGGSRNGTWMHRFLAVDFAAWLDPFLKLWINETIEEMLFGFASVQVQAIQNTVVLKDRIKTLREKPNKTVEDFEEYIKCEDQLKGETSTRAKATKQKVQEVRNLFNQPPQNN